MQSNLELILNFLSDLPPFSILAGFGMCLAFYTVYRITRN